MNTAQRLQQLRKEKGMSQEELAERLGVSRQAVSKWESGQSSPDVEKIVAASELFGVTTDWLLKGVRPAEEPAPARRKLAGRILFAASPAMVAAGLFLAHTGRQELRPFAACAGFAAQAVGLALYFIGQTLAGEKGPFWPAWLDLAGVAPLPLYSLTARAAIVLLDTEMPWETFKALRGAAFWLVYLALLAAGFFLLRKRK